MMAKKKRRGRGRKSRATAAPRTKTDVTVALCEKVVKKYIDDVVGKNNGLNKGGHKNKYIAGLLGISDTTVRRVVQAYNECGTTDGKVLLEHYTIIMRAAHKSVATGKKAHYEFNDVPVVKEVVTKKATPTIEPIVKQYIIQAEHTGVIIPMIDYKKIIECLGNVAYYFMDDETPLGSDIRNLNDLMGKYITFNDDGTLVASYVCAEPIDPSKQYEILIDDGVEIVTKNESQISSTVEQYREGVM